MYRSLSEFRRLVFGLKRVQSSGGPVSGCLRLASAQSSNFPFNCQRYHIERQIRSRRDCSGSSFRLNCEYLVFAFRDEMNPPEDRKIGSAEEPPVLTNTNDLEDVHLSLTRAKQSLGEILNTDDHEDVRHNILQEATDVLTELLMKILETPATRSMMDSSDGEEVDYRRLSPKIPLLMKINHHLKSALITLEEMHFEKEAMKQEFVWRSERRKRREEREANRFEEPCEDRLKDVSVELARLLMLKNGNVYLYSEAKYNLMVERTDEVQLAMETIETFRSKVEKLDIDVWSDSQMAEIEDIAKGLLDHVHKLRPG